MFAPVLWPDQRNVFPITEMYSSLDWLPVHFSWLVSAETSMWNPYISREENERFMQYILFTPPGNGPYRFVLCEINDTNLYWYVTLVWNQHCVLPETPLASFSEVPECDFVVSVSFIFNEIPVCDFVASVSFIFRKLNTTQDLTEWQQRETFLLGLIIFRTGVCFLVKQVVIFSSSIRERVWLKGNLFSD